MDIFGLDIASRDSWTRDAFGRPEGFLIQGNPDDCRECWGCVRYCPARAIRVANGTSEIVAERCVKCGACVSECGNRGHVVRDDTPAVRELLRGDRPVVALLATEFVAALHPIPSAEVERALESLGFYAVESTLLGEELVAAQYERLHSRSGMPVTLRSTCPVAVEWVKRYRPSFVTALTPLVPPYIAQARLIRALYPKGTAVVYVSPCYARKDEVHDEDIEGAVDVAIDFVELKRLLAAVQLHPAGSKQFVGARRPEPLKELSLTDGFPRSTLVERDKTDSEVVAVRGLRQLDKMLVAIENGEAMPAILDMLNCDGCIDGPAVNPGLSVFAKRNIVTAERETRGRTSVRSKDLLSHLPLVEVVRSFKASPILIPVPTPEQVDEVLAEGDFPDRSRTLDCGACGYGTCVEHAEAIIAGLSTWELCFPLQRRRMRETNEMLEQVATSDSLTDLLNRRGFDERFAEEVARGRRYGSPLSLMMMDVDGFKDVNDRLGHAAGDAVLRGVAEVLREGLRETDIPTRYGGDEFALVLPGIGKTEAYAVAEKLREAVSSLRFNDEQGESFDDLRVTISVGVASLSQVIDGASSLLESADAALYDAKRSGRDQVRLAAG